MEASMLVEHQEFPIVQPPWRDPARGLVGVLQERRREAPARACIHAVESRHRELQAAPLSLETLFSRAERAAALLEQRGARAGDRVMFSLAQPHAFASWFLGALGRGIVPVPLPPLGGLGTPASYRERVTSTATDCGARLAVVESADGWAHALAGTGAPDTIEASLVETLGPRIGLDDQPLDQVAFLQYTSGSTSTPKGVVVTHGNLAANLGAISCGMGVAEGERMITWLPLHHDMGLIGGLLWPIFAGGETFVMTPLTFLSRPATWLEAVGRWRGTVTVAPNFAFSLCVRKVPDEQLEGVDLSSLRLALCGAEPIDAEVVRAFGQRFARFGFGERTFFPVYGLAEATLAVAFPSPGAPMVFDTVDRDVLATRGRAEPVARTELARTVVSVGEVLAGHAIEIVSPTTGKRCGEREVGEIVVRGPSVSPRYWSDSPADAPRQELRTGDLGYLAGGQLFIIDRLKDLIIVAGENFAPSEIEAAATVKGVRFGGALAFGTRDPQSGTEKVVVVCEFDAKSGIPAPAVIDTVRACVRARVGHAPETVLVSQGTIEKTTSGKLRRRACRDRYEAGLLERLK
jgi:fatty-acyl-CoA synthase